MWKFTVGAIFWHYMYRTVLCYYITIFLLHFINEKDLFLTFYTDTSTYLSQPRKIFALQFLCHYKSMKESLINFILVK